MLSALEYCRQHDRFAANNGIELLEASPGHARAQMTVVPERFNSIGSAHGGSIFSLAATTFFMACNASGQTAVGTNMTITCLKMATQGVLTAEATEISRSRRLSHVTVRVTDEGGDLVALFQGTAYIKHSPFPPEVGQTNRE